MLFKGQHNTVISCHLERSQQPTKVCWWNKRACYSNERGVREAGSN